MCIAGKCYLLLAFISPHTALFVFTAASLWLLAPSFVKHRSCSAPGRVKDVSLINHKGADPVTLVALRSFCVQQTQLVTATLPVPDHLQ